MFERLSTLFIEILTAYARLRQSIADDFFIDRLDRKINEFVESFIKLETARTGDDVAQYLNTHSYIVTAYRELLEEIEYVGSADITSLLTCQERLLRYQLQFLKNRTHQSVSKKIEPSKKIQPDSSGQDLSSRVIAPRARTRSATQKINKTQEQIFNFIKQKHSAGKKEITDRFNVLSERTIQRSLRGLIQVGLLRKHTEHGLMQYSVI